MSNYAFAILCMLLAAHCKRPSANQTVAEAPSLPQTQIEPAATKGAILCPDEMLEYPAGTIPGNLFAPKNREEEICGWYMPDDTITPKGNFVRYLISNDSCCLGNLYLEWGNDRFRKIESLGELRLYSEKMTPQYVGESGQYLFMESAASSGSPVAGCFLWLFPLTSGHQSETYPLVAYGAYDLKSLTIVRQAEGTKTEHQAFEAYNIQTHRVKPIKLKNRVSTADPIWAIDSISVTHRIIFLSVQTVGSHGEIVNEKIILPNDIK